MQLGTIPDITPAGTATPLTTGEIKATWVKLTAVGATIRVGDSLVGSSRGSLLETGVPYTLERGNFDQQGYDLTKVFVYGTSSDKVSITYGV